MDELKRFLVEINGGMYMPNIPTDEDERMERKFFDGLDDLFKREPTTKEELTIEEKRRKFIAKNNFKNGGNK